MTAPRVAGASLTWSPAVTRKVDMAVMARVLDALRGLDVGDTSRQRKELDMSLSRRSNQPEDDESWGDSASSEDDNLDIPDGY